MKVLVTRRPPGEAVAALSEHGDLWLWPHDSEIDDHVLRREVEDADALHCMITDRIDRPLLESTSRLKVISTMAVGVDNIDIDACRDLGIAVGHTPDILTGSTATWPGRC